MAQSTTVETDGVQIKVWIPAAFYDLLKAQAARNQTSVAAEARRLMQAGLAPLGTVDDLKSDLIKLSQFVHLHLEPLAFIAAMDSAFSRESWRLQFYGSRPADAAEVDHKLGLRATKRLQRKLRALDPPKEPEGQVSTDGDEEDED